jgi:hypothetical protein
LQNFAKPRDRSGITAKFQLKYKYRTPALPNRLIENSATFIDDNRLFFTAGLLIPLAKNLKILFLGLGTHKYTSVSEPFFDNILFEAIRYP